MAEKTQTPLQPPETQEDEEEKREMYAYGLYQRNVEDRLRRLMEGLRSEFGGPPFDPHLTLVGPQKLTAGEAKLMFEAACEGFLRRIRPPLTSLPQELPIFSVSMCLSGTP
ncbi:hypothetical protein HID58_029500 [Brassica napus]|uniref:RNA ligase/cyclic nucleotide phosphodiesterase family protein n=1 Tax=Brassica napus TaxID=3708 RepID=A0ABQ8CDB8_BRANA|nr:hypothetical protein HID58_029500 [Brassica napus]